MRSILLLVAFLAAVLGCGIAIGTIFTPGQWYAALVKPSFNPPNSIFPPAWSLLYILIAVAGWRIWERAHRSQAMKLWFLQMGLNFLWSPVFFGAHLIGFGFAIILGIFIAIIAFIRHAWGTDRTAALLFLPYGAWIAFATVLNAALLYLNAG